MTQRSKEKSSKANYDRWKPGTKLACMMTLRRMSSDSQLFDPVMKKFNSLIWHIVAESLNKEYPDFAKRFTNINVKDRYDRVLKHHRVFAQMANKSSGFVWNPEMFCFEGDEALMKQYQKKERVDEVICSELNITKLLCKHGHIDLEYFHRFIYQSTDQDDSDNDTVLNSPSYIEDAISKGILSKLSSKSKSKSSKTQSPLISTGPSTGPASGSTLNNSESEMSPKEDEEIALDRHDRQDTSDNLRSISLDQSQSQQIQQRTLQQQQHALSTDQSLPSPAFQRASIQEQQPQFPLQQTMPQPQLVSHTLLHSVHLHPHDRPRPPPPHQHHHHQHLHHHHHQQQHGPNLMAIPIIHQHAIAPPDDLDFSGLMDSQGGMINSHQLSQIPIIPSISPHANIGTPHKIGGTSSSESSTDSAIIRKRFRSTKLPITILQPGLLVDQFEAMQQNDGALPSADEHQMHPGNLQQQPGKGMSTGEAVLIIHKEFEIMKTVVSEEILQLRAQKVITYEDFQTLQETQESNLGFIRTAYKRILGNEKILDLINIYLNKS